MRTIAIWILLMVLGGAPGVFAQEPGAEAGGAPRHYRFRVQFQPGEASTITHADVQQIVRMAIASRGRRPVAVPDGAEPPPAYLDVWVGGETEGEYALTVGCVSPEITNPDAQEPFRMTFSGEEMASLLRLGAELMLMVRLETAVCPAEVPAG